MRFVTAWLIFLFVAVASGETSSEEISVTTSEGTTETNLSLSNNTEVVEKSNSTTEQPVTDNGSKNITNGQLRKNDESDLVTDKDVAIDELIFEKAIGVEDEIIKDQNQDNSFRENAENDSKPDDVINNPEDPTESKISKDFIDIRRQASSSKGNQENSRPSIQFDDSKKEAKSDVPLKYGQRKFRQKIQDSAPLLQLTQGGYERPYKRPRYRGRYVLKSRPDSSEQSRNMQQVAGISNNNKLDSNPIVPQVTYIPSSQLPFAYEQGPLTNTPFDTTARNMLAVNQIIPPAAQNEFFNSLPAEFTSYSNAAFQPQFESKSDINNIPSFSSDPNNAGVYQILSSNRFQSPRNLFQNLPQPQPQSAMMGEGRNVQAQFQQNPLAVYPGYQIIEDSSSPDYASFFRNPAINTPFQAPPNFYDNAPNTLNPFSNPPISILPQYPSIDNRSPQLFQYPEMRSGLQNDQQSTNNQQVVSDASQNVNKAKEAEKNSDKPVNHDDSIVKTGPFRTRLQTDNIANVYMRYPTAEAGYAIVENLPIQNYSNESKNDDIRSKEEQTNSPTAIPNKIIWKPVRNNQQINSSFFFPSELFRSVPIEYRSPPESIFTRYPDRNRAIPNYPSRDFQSRIPFLSTVSLPGSFLGVNNQQQYRRESNETPACAKEKNVSVCFEDNEYPKNDILYTINSNSFLTDRFLNRELSLDSFDFVERNGNGTEQNEENYACEVATKYGMPLRAKNLAGIWRIVVNIQGRFSQPLRMEVCKTLGSSCSHTDSRVKTTCVQKFSLQRLLTWSSSRGIYSDVYKIPIACSCQITQPIEN